MLLSLVMRKKLLEVIDVSLRLIVELLVQQRILLLKCRNLCLNRAWDCWYDGSLPQNCPGGTAS